MFINTGCHPARVPTLTLSFNISTSYSTATAPLETSPILSCILIFYLSSATVRCPALLEEVCSKVLLFFWCLPTPASVLWPPCCSRLEPRRFSAPHHPFPSSGCHPATSKTPTSQESAQLAPQSSLLRNHFRQPCCSHKRNHNVDIPTCTRDDYPA